MNQRDMVKWANAEYRQIKKKKKHLDRLNKMMEKIEAKTKYPRDAKGRRIKTDPWGHELVRVKQVWTLRCNVPDSYS